MNPTYSSDIFEFCEVIRNHVAFSPARKTYSISVLALLQGRNHARSSSDTDFSIIFPKLILKITGISILLRCMVFYFELK